MDAFIPLTFGLFILLVLVMMGLARAFQGTSASQILDWKPTRDYETEIQLEQDDVTQMLEAQNEMRRKKGKKDISIEDVHRAAEEDERLRMRGKGPFGGQGG
jgi:hypothetical protein